MLSIIVPSLKEPGLQEVLQQIEDCCGDVQIIISHDRYRKGKGWAVREALKHARGEYIAFLDGDMDIHPRMLLRLLPFIADFDAVVGTKRIAHKHWTRRAVTHLSRMYIRAVFGLGFDTQTGIKLFRAEALEPWKSNGFLFDVEILHKITKRGSRIIEVPVEAEISERMTWKTLWRTFAESLYLRFRLSFPVKN